MITIQRLRCRAGRVVAMLMMAAVMSLSQQAQAQFNTTLFEDDFSSGTLDPAKYQADSPFFEGGQGDIHAETADGVLKFVGTTSQQWWSGGTLRVAQTFTASESAAISFSIDRVAEAGVGTASRSALWVMDETQTRYVLFADVRAEGGWRFNRKIGEDGDVPTGSGTDIGVFNGGTFDDSALHRMTAVADGKVVKLYLDGQLGVEVKFPFNRVRFHVGSYARANNDTADTTFDNLKIEEIKRTKVLFEDDFASGAIDAGKYQPDAPFFEGGQGDIHAEAADGVLRFVGTTTQQWWSGGTLRVVPTFTATEQTPVQVTIDRVAEAGVGTASRSALWILDETRTRYVLFADVRAEGGWRYNRKIGADGDVPTGSGTDIGVFNGGTFDDGGQHQMRVFANGKTVKLFVDGLEGAEVAFPFSKLVVEFGAYARANNDTANTTFDNLKIETIVPSTTRVFEDDFTSGTLDPAKYQPDAPFFEGGVGDIHAEAGDGVVKFVGTTTQQWWSGGTLRVVPTFEASDESVVTVNIDRVSEAGLGTASRSALWILDETRTKYVLFADVRAEGGWRYNRKIGEDGDVPTGSGTDIAVFNGAGFDNGGLHRMSMVADGKTVKLLLDGVEGAEVKFPFSPIVVEFGAYARANNDTANTTFDNLTIDTTGGAGLSPSDVSVRVGARSAPVTLSIPRGLNATKLVQVKVVSSNPAVAVPEGGVGGTLTVNFPAGGPNTTTFRAQGVAVGTASFSVEGDLLSPNPIHVAVITGPGVLLEEGFDGAEINASVWEVSSQGFETGLGTFTVQPLDGGLDINGIVDEQYWAGASVKTVNGYVASRELNLVFEVDRGLLEYTGTAGRTGVYITTADRSKYVFFGQNLGENNWQVNVNPGNPTGGGTTLSVFAGITDGGAHRMKLVANGQTVKVYLDDVLGGEFAFAVNSDIHFEVGSYARANGDTVHGYFDNVRIENTLPCIGVSPTAINMTQSASGQNVTITIPQLLNDLAAAQVTVTSRDKNVAVPNGNASGSVVLNFAVGAATSQSFVVTGVSKGSTVFDIVSVPSACVVGSVAVDVVSDPVVLLSDTFSGSEVDFGLWRLDNTPFVNGTPTDTSAITVEDGVVKVDVTAQTASWPGLALFTQNSYNASATAPVSFEIDRTKLDFVLVTGTDANQRSGIWVRNPEGNFVLFADNVAHNGRNLGWRYNRLIGTDSDNPAGDGINIAAFDAPLYNDQGSHRMAIVVNGSTAKLYLDGILGEVVDFPFSDGLIFGFGAYVAAATDVVRGYFDNALITGGESISIQAALVNGQVQLTWSAGAILQSTSSIGPENWSDVTPAPAGNTLTITPGAAAKQFFRVRQ